MSQLPLDDPWASFSISFMQFLLFMYHEEKKLGERKVLAQAVAMAWWEILIYLFSKKQEVVES